MEIINFLESTQTPVNLNPLKLKIKSALEVIKKTLDQYKYLHILIFSNLFNYRKPNVGIHFNGGKDCTVVLYLIRACTHLKDISVIYFEKQQEFDEVKLFRSQIESMY